MLLAGPDNPLGPFKFGLGMSGYLIHGSNKKFGIGMRTSHGCFRMYNDNVLELADMAPVGTTVRIISEPYKFGISGGKVYLEAHTPVDDLGNPSVVDKHTAVINALLKRDDLANNLRMNWDRVRDRGSGRRRHAGRDRSAGGCFCERGRTGDFSVERPIASRASACWQSVGRRASRTGITVPIDRSCEASPITRATTSKNTQKKADPLPDRLSTTPKDYYLRLALSNMRRARSLASSAVC